MKLDYLQSWVAVGLAVAAPLAWAQRGAPAGEWRTYGGDLGHTRYAPLDQIDASNFNRLEIAWRFKTDSLGPNREFNFQSTPLMVDGVIYSTAGRAAPSSRSTPATASCSGSIGSTKASAAKSRRGSSRAAGSRIGRAAKTNASST